MNILSDLVNIVVTGLLVYTVINLVIAHIVVPLLKRKIDKLTAEESSLRSVMPVDVEMIGTQYYCYNDDTKEFLCQGSTLQEITERFVKLYPGVVGELYSSDTAVITKLTKDITA